LQHPEERRQRTALREAVVDRKVTCEPAVEEHSGARPVGELADPGTDAGGEAHRLGATVEPLTVHPVVRLGDVEEDGSPRQLRRTKLLKKTLLQQHVVPNPPALDEGRLLRVDHKVQGDLHAVSDHSGTQFVVCVEERDRPVAPELVTRQAFALVDGDDDAFGPSGRANVVVEDVVDGSAEGLG
jgi:hypothetical protein